MLNAKRDSGTKVLRAFFSKSLQVRQTARNGSVILLVEDNDFYASMLHDMLTGRLGQPVHHVKTVAAAQKFVEERGDDKIRCVLIDISLREPPHGDTLIAWLLHNHPKLPLVVHTAADEKTLSEIKQRYRYVQIVLKGDSPDKLIDALGFDLSV